MLFFPLESRRFRVRTALVSGGLLAAACVCVDPAAGQGVATRAAEAPVGAGVLQGVALQTGAAKPAAAQEAESTTVLTVVDPAGAKVRHAAVVVFAEGTQDNAALKSLETDGGGQVTLLLPSGTYTVQVSAKGFVDRRQTVQVSARGGQATVKLAIATKDEVVNVSGEDGAGGDAGTANGEALVLRGSQLRSLSDDPTVLQQQLNSMVATDDGSAPQLRIDGFSGGRLPPKSSIREIRVNQNAFSAQFDQRGNSVLDIFTKPGTDKLHGFVYVQGNADPFNARNPYITTTQPGYHSTFLLGNLNGPLNKTTSFFLGVQRDDQENNAAVNAVVLDASNNSAAFSQAVPNPSITQSYNARVDHQFGANNTFTGRFDFANTHQVETGVGQLVLRSQGYTSDTKTSTLQLGNTSILGPHVVFESRFQYLRTRSQQLPDSSAPTLTVQGSFNGGGSGSQTFRDAQDNYEFQEYLSVDHGKHFFRAGVRYRLTRDSNSSTAGYNGSYTFPTLSAYQITLRGIAAGQTPAQIRAAGGGASQYSVTAGTPSAILTTGDLGAYFEDEWKATPKLTVTTGLRYESQFGIPDHNDPAPRLGFSYRVTHGSKPLFTLRGGVGLFYDRFPASNLLIAARQNGVLQRSYYIQNPDFYPNAPTPASLSSVQPTVYQVAPNLHSSYTLSEGVSANRGFGKYGSASLNFTTEHGTHLFLSRNANAPLNGVRPLGGTQNVYQYASEGTSDTHTISTNYNLQLGPKVFLWGFYALRFRQTQAMGIGSFVSNSYDLSQDFGRTPSLTRHRLFLGGYTQLPFGFSQSTFVAAHSTERFNITTGQDNNGDSIFNDRPAFATDLSRASVVRTAFGDFDTAPMAGQKIIPIDYGKAPGLVSVTTQFGRSFAFGPQVKADPEAPKPKPGTKPVKPDRIYHLYLAAQAENLFNHVNPASPVGQLSSPYFGRSLTLSGDQASSTAANRLVAFFASFNF